MTFDWHTIAGTFSGILLALLLIPYIASVIKGPTRPNVVSWSGWALLAGIATTIQFVEGASWSIVVPLITTINGAIVSLIALRWGYAKFTLIDITCFIAGIAATGLWLLAHQPLVALFLVVAADFLFTLPTIVKTYRDSFSEPALLWFLYTVGISISIGASTIYDIYNLLYPISAMLLSAAIWLLALHGRLKRSTIL